MIKSIPSDPAQPSTQFYNIDALYTIIVHTRSGVEANNGPEPPFDMSQGERTWWDDSATGPKTYNVFDDNTNTFKTITLDARKPNFKGLPNYPKWTPAQTVALIPGTLGTSDRPVDPRVLSTEDQAKALQAELGGTGYQDTGLSSVVLPVVGTLVFPINYGTETRREWAVVLSNGKQFNVGQALTQKYINGIGAPGQWVADSGFTSGLSWKVTAIVDGSASTLQPVPPPCRALLPNEKIAMVQIGILQQVQVERTDLVAPTPAGTAGTGDSTAIADIHTKVNRMFSLMFPNG
jgi:hypothetical protein